MANEVIQRTGLAVTSEPGILEVALDDTAALQQPTDALGNLLDQNL